MLKLVRPQWLVLFAAAAAGAADGDRYEMWEEPSHQLVFVEGPARVLDVRIAPGVTSDFHKHRFATAYVIIQDALVANQFFEDEWSASGPRELRAAGETVDNANYVAKPYYHRVRNEDDKVFHVVAIINERSLETKSEASEDSAPGTAIENAWFREHRIKLTPGSSSDELTYSNDVVLVQYDDGPSCVVENEIKHSFKSAAAAFSWHAAGSKFHIANQGKQTLEVVLVEIKQ